jgi:flagellar basal body P-ring formation protein FlgA
MIQDLSLRALACTAANLLPLAARTVAALAVLMLLVPSTRAADTIEAFVLGQVGSGTRVEVQVGQLDPRVQLAPCQQIEPYLLPGTRLWGRTAIGVRCVEGANWRVALPVTVSVWGKALVAAAPLSAGMLPSEELWREDEVELTRETGTPVTDPAQLVGKTLIRQVAAGQTLRHEFFRIAQTVAPGDPVQIRLNGRGFSILADGQALAGAGEGQSLRARTDSGRVVGGTLRGRTVEIDL